MKLKIIRIPWKFHEKLTDTILCREDFRSVIELNIHPNAQISDVGIIRLCNLRRIELYGVDCVPNITDTSISVLTNLNTLIIHGHSNITNTGICKLTNLNILAVFADITDSGISNLTNLKRLHILGNISNRGLKNLTNLEFLSIGLNNEVTNDGIKHLTKLTGLYTSESKITTEVIPYLPKLLLFNGNKI